MQLDIHCSTIKHHPKEILDDEVEIVRNELIKTKNAADCG